MPEITFAHSEAGAVPTVLPHPSAPTCFEETGLSLDLLLQLTLKHMHFAGELTGSDLAQRLGLRFPAIEPAGQGPETHHPNQIRGGAAVAPAPLREPIHRS